MYIIYIYNNNPSVLDKYNSSSFFVKRKRKGNYSHNARSNVGI